MGITSSVGVVHALITHTAAPLHAGWIAT